MLAKNSSELVPKNMKLSSNCDFPPWPLSGSVRSQLVMFVVSASLLVSWFTIFDRTELKDEQKNLIRVVYLDLLMVVDLTRSSVAYLRT